MMLFGFTRQKVAQTDTLTHSNDAQENQCGTEQGLLHLPPPACPRHLHSGPHGANPEHGPPPRGASVPPWFSVLTWVRMRAHQEGCFHITIGVLRSLLFFSHFFFFLYENRLSEIINHQKVPAPLSSLSEMVCIPPPLGDWLTAGQLD